MNRRCYQSSPWQAGPRPRQIIPGSGAAGRRVRLNGTPRAVEKYQFFIGGAVDVVFTATCADRERKVPHRIRWADFCCGSSLARSLAGSRGNLFTGLPVRFRPRHLAQLGSGARRSRREISCREIGSSSDERMKIAGIAALSKSD